MEKDRHQGWRRSKIRRLVISSRFCSKSCHQLFYRRSAFKGSEEFSFFAVEGEVGEVADHIKGGHEIINILADYQVLQVIDLVFLAELKDIPELYAWHSDHHDLD